MARRMDIAVKSKIKTLSDLSRSKRQIAKEVGFSERAVSKFSPRLEILIEERVPTERTRVLFTPTSEKTLTKQENEGKTAIVGQRKKNLGCFRMKKSPNLAWWAQMEESGYGENKESDLRKNV
ncbi:hypothetical protein ILUMI_10728 [Ignelater luminosus]|uniref:Uncharacterized protein n=1 Tax=Ignelater luminosus TaxID=2038154 RepID=A0A8K0D3D2_IGNLU|nr:hypothetical protein ILUMI_10728 [Ignelater luminosus]